MKVFKSQGIHPFDEFSSFVLGTLSKDKFIFEALNYTDAFLFQKPNMKTVNGMDSKSESGIYAL